MYSLEYKKDFSIEKHFFSKYYSSDLCVCSNLHVWYLTTNNFTITKTIFSFYLSIFQKKCLWFGLVICHNWHKNIWSCQRSQNRTQIRNRVHTQKSEDTSTHRILMRLEYFGPQCTINKFPSCNIIMNKKKLFAVKIYLFSWNKNIE